MVDISTGGNTVPAQLIHKKREVLKGENEFADIVVWAVAPLFWGAITATNTDWLMSLTASA